MLLMQLIAKESSTVTCDVAPFVVDLHRRKSIGEMKRKIVFGPFHQLL